MLGPVNLRTMPCGSGNFIASLMAEKHRESFKQTHDPAVRELGRHIDLWEFLTMDARPTMILDKSVAQKTGYGLMGSPIVYQNKAFEKLALSLDVPAFLLKLSKTTPGVPLYMSGRVWGNYTVGTAGNRNWIIITGDSTQYSESYSWVPAEGWINPSAIPTPGPDQELQYVRRESSRDGTRTKDRTSPSNPMLDWTRPSGSRWLPEHYRIFHNINWKESALGRMTSWPSALRTVVNTVMMSPFQMVLYWGPRHITIYNEAYVDVVRQRHPQLLGKPLGRAWPEAYNMQKQFMRQARSGKTVVRIEDKIAVDRRVRAEECYFDWTMTPILVRAGKVGGVLCHQYESTARVLLSRRTQALKTLRATTATTRQLSQFWPAVLESFDGDTLDTPFILVYEAAHGNEAILLESRGIPDGHRLAPQLIILAEDDYFFSREMRRSRQTGGKVLKTNIEDQEFITGVNIRGFKEPCSAAVVLPIMTKTDTLSGAASLNGSLVVAFMIIGLNPRRPFDDDYETWIDQIQVHVSRYLAEAKSLETEWHRAMDEKLEDVNKRRATELSFKLTQLETELRQTELRFMKMAEAIPVGLVELSLDGTEVYRNAAFVEIMMLKDKDAPWQEVVHPDDVEFAVKFIDNAVKTGVQCQAEARIIDIRPNTKIPEETKWISAEVVPMYGDNGMLMGFYKTIVDITPLKTAEGVQKERAEEAIQRNDQQERFIDMTCHELRNPLSAILQSAELIFDLVSQPGGSKAAIDTQEIKDACETIILCVTHQRRIIDDILVTSKLDSNLIPINPTDVQPAQYIEKWMRVFEPEMDDKDINLSCIVDESYRSLMIDWVKVDPQRLMQILVNLITNAAKFTAREPVREIEVHIAASNERPTQYGTVSYSQGTEIGHEESEELLESPDWGDGEIVYMMFSVKDSGLGISDEHQRTLFQRFYQVPKSAGKYGGSGLGLYICRKLAALQGGLIGVHSEPERQKGAEFAFFVKCRRGTRPDKPPEKDFSTFNSESSGSSRRGSVNIFPMGAGSANRPKQDQKKPERAELKILIVEDNMVNQKVLQRQLNNNKCVTYTANNGLEACEFVERSQLGKDSDSAAPDIDICLMDWEMPVMDGLEATKRIRNMETSGQLKRNLPILGVTANVRANQVEGMKDAGMDGIITKPFRISDLMSKAAAFVKMNRFEHGNTGMEKKSTQRLPGNDQKPSGERKSPLGMHESSLNSIEEDP